MSVAIDMQTIHLKAYNQLTTIMSNRPRNMDNEYNKILTSLVELSNAIDPGIEVAINSLNNDNETNHPLLISTDEIAKTFNIKRENLPNEPISSYSDWLKLILQQRSESMQSNDKYNEFNSQLENLHSFLTNPQDTQLQLIRKTH